MTGIPEPLSVSPATQELRFATAMTGGVSLAIWMGGVARELNLLQRASNQRKGLQALPEVGEQVTPDRNVQTLYLRLLNLLDTTVDADILAGTSAGGINAALLGMARVNDLDLGGLRGMWLSLGALEDLLRDPGEDAPPSLLQGDDKLLEGLKSSLENLWDRSEPTAPEPEWPPTRVHLTTTLIMGESGRFTDSYGTLVQDVTHQGMFTFDEEMLAQPPVRAALAAAARCTASFPLAFEPGFISLDGGDEGRPAMKGYANITRAQWASDGGLLMNRPIQPMLQEIFDRRADRHVRRVLLYVIPSPGDQPDPRTTPEPAELSAPLTMAEALLGDVKAVMAQSVAADLRAVRDHNDRVDSLCDTRLRMAQLAGRIGAPPAGGEGGPLPGLVLTDATMFADYCVRQSDWFVRPIVAALMREIASRAQSELPPAWRAALAPGSEIELQCMATAAQAIAAQWHMPGVAPDSPEAWYGLLAKFGLAPFEGAKATAITMVRSAFTLAGRDGDRANLTNVLKAIHTAFGFGPAAGAPEQRADGYQDAFRRPRVSTVVSLGVDALLTKPMTDTDLPSAAAALAVAYRKTLEGEPRKLDSAWGSLADALVSARPEFEALMNAPSRASEGSRIETIDTIRRERLSGERAIEQLETYVSFLGAGDASTVAARLFDLHLATRSVLPVAVEVEQPVELVQVSADSRTLLSKRKTAAEKLTGMQLHHFGAFYKSSWRANDWMWGRIDGAGWLVHLLLDPRRINALTPNPPEQRDPITPQRETRAKVFYDRLRQAIGASDPVSAADTELRENVLKELAFLDGEPPKASLPMTAQWVARELHRWIATEELPVVAQEMIANPSKSVDPWAKRVLDRVGPIEGRRAGTVAESWVGGAVSGKRTNEELVEVLTSLLRTAEPSTTPPTPWTAPEPPLNVAMGDELASCPVPGEKLGQQVGQPLMTRTVAKAGAVAAAMVSGIKQPIAVIKPPLTMLRTITMAAYRMVTAARGRRTPLLAIGAVTMLVGLVLALNNTELLGFAGVGMFVVGFLVLGIVTWGWSKNGRKSVLAAIVLGAVLVPVVAREWLFGNGTCDDKSCPRDKVGWFGREALPWLAASPWNVVIVIAVFAGIAMAIGGLASFARRIKPLGDLPVLVASGTAGVAIGVAGAITDAFSVWVPLAVAVGAAGLQAASTLTSDDTRASPRRKPRSGPRKRRRSRGVQAARSMQVTTPSPERPVRGLASATAPEVRALSTPVAADGWQPVAVDAPVSTTKTSRVGRKLKQSFVPAMTVLSTTAAVAQLVVEVAS